MKVSYLERHFVNEVYEKLGYPKTFISQATHGKVLKFGRYVPDYVIFDEQRPDKIREIG